MNRRCVLLLICAACLQTGCWTVYETGAARQLPPPLPANPDGVCPAIAPGVYAPGPDAGYFGTVVEEDEGLAGMAVPASWPRPATSVERLADQRLKIVRMDLHGNFLSTGFVKPFKRRSVQAREGDITEESCDQGVYYHKFTGTGGLAKVDKLIKLGVNYHRFITETDAPDGSGPERFFSMKTVDMEYVWTVSKGENEEIIENAYMKIRSRPFYIFALGNSRRAETKHYRRISDKPLKVDALKPKAEEKP